jgi:transcriptional regulator with XRE-family HTH domain
MVNFRSSMGERMKKQRKLLHLTQEQIAEALNISVKHYGGVERGNAGLSLENLLELSEILGVSLDYLVKGEKHQETIPSRLIQIYLECPVDKRPYIIDLLELIRKF